MSITENPGSRSARRGGKAVTKLSTCRTAPSPLSEGGLSFPTVNSLDSIVHPSPAVNPPGRRLLFISNLFPDAGEIYRGLDNAVLLGYLRAHFGEIRAMGLRPTLKPTQWGLHAPGSGPWQAREEDAWLRPWYLGTPYVPKLGSYCNDRLLAAQLGPALRQVQPQFAYDAVLCSWLFPDAAALARTQPPQPFVLICQGSDAHQYLRIPARRRAILGAVASSRGVVTRSADLARLLREAGAPAEKLHPIYNGADARFRPLPTLEREALREELGVPAGAVVTLFVGNFLPVKNPRLLLESFAEAARVTAVEGIRPQLLMVGGGPLEGNIRDWISELGLGEVVRLEGRLPAAQVARRMQVADVLCMSSRNEGVPNVVLEAQATGVPVISTAVGGIGEIIKLPVQGELVGSAMAPAAELGAALSRAWRVAANPGENAKRQREIAALAATYSWEKTAEAYTRLF